MLELPAIEAIVEALPRTRCSCGSRTSRCRASCRTTSASSAPRRRAFPRRAAPWRRDPHSTDVAAVLEQQDAGVEIGRIHRGGPRAPIDVSKRCTSRNGSSRSGSGKMQSSSELSGNPAAGEHHGPRSLPGRRRRSWRARRLPPRGENRRRRAPAPSRAAPRPSAGRRGAATAGRDGIARHSIVHPPLPPAPPLSEPAKNVVKTARPAPRWRTAFTLTCWKPVA